MGKRRRTPQRARRTSVLLGSAAVVTVCGAGFGGWALLSEDRIDVAAQARPVDTSPPEATEVRATSRAFLRAWAAGEAGAAAALTDAPATARPLLSGYRTQAHLGEVRLRPGAARGTTVPFEVRAKVSYGGTSKPFSYGSELTVVRRPGDGHPAVRWQPSVLHPALHAGDVLRTGPAGTAPVTALDRDGKELSGRVSPSLTTVLESLRARYGDKAGGTPGVSLRVVKARGGDAKNSGAAQQGTQAGGEQDSGKTLLALTPGTPGRLRTTLSARVQAVAEAQVARSAQSAVVVVRPSTGEILAVANSRPGGFNTAFSGSIAPGSTMKIVTASLLLEKDLAGYDRPHPCPKYASYGGWRFHNVEKFAIKGGTFRDSFGASCNTAFITQAKELDDAALTRQAQEVFGLGRDNWAIGVPSFDGSVPVQRDAPKAASLIGQGGVRMNPLNVASVLSTAKTGVFRQPYLVAPGVDHRSLAKADRTLSGSAQRQLRQLLTYTAVSGSGAEPMAGLGPDVGAKTGSAEVDHQDKPNGWFTAWRGDLAAAAVVQQGGRGGESAGPIVRSLLLAGS